MRLAAQEKMGFYPAPPDACEGLLKHLTLGKASGKATEHYVLDPCAGEGAFISQLAEGMHVPQKNVHAVELHKGRGEAIRLLMPAAQVLAPCSLFQALVGPRSFGLIYVNPPFDDKLGGGGREETEFVKESWHLLADNGVIVVVSPLKTFQGRDFIRFIDNHFVNAMLYRFNEPQYSEVVMVARKRSQSLGLPEYSGGGLLNKAYALNSYHRGSYDYERGRYPGINSIQELPVIGSIAAPWEDGHPIAPPVRPMTEDDAKKWVDDELRLWEIPCTYKPTRWAKGMYTDEELVEAVGKSPNNALFRETKEPPLQESPLPLDRGHVALLVTSGALDGLIETPHGHHVMRGISRKREELNEDLCKSTISDDGLTMKVVEVHSETMDTKIRAVDSDCAIYTFSMAPRTIEGIETKYDISVSAVDGYDPAELSCSIPVERPTGGVDYISVRLNDEEDVSFCLDTGASPILISGELASKLQLMRTGKTKHCTNADGMTSSNPEGLIGTLQIGKFVISNLRCTIHERPGPGFDPLLGQAVLRFFDYSYSQSDGTITISLAKKESKDETHSEHSTQSAHVV